MIGNKNIIGVCVTKVQDPPHARTLAALHEVARKKDFHLMVFNSPFDFSAGTEAEHGAEAVYDLINYDVIDALIVMCSEFINKAVLEKMITKAQHHHIPIILEDVESEGCYTVKNYFEDSLSNLLNHVIRDHGVKDTFFIAGIKDNDYSDQRVNVYKRVLADNHLEFKDDMVDYGGFWEWPTIEVMDRLFSSGKPLPKAIFCANDAMGVAVCKYLQKKNIKVPEDVIVTGFDGSRAGEFSEPRMATCVVNMKGFAEKCISIIESALLGEAVQQVYNNDYVMRKAESCGCDSGATVEFKKMAQEYHRMSVDAIGNEYVTYNNINNQLSASTMDGNMFYSVLSQILDPVSYFAIKPSWLFQALNESEMNTETDDELVLLEKADDSLGRQTRYSIRDIVPQKEEWIEGNSLYVISSVHIGSMNCGYYMSRSSNIKEDAQRINRAISLINIIIHMAVSDMKQRYYKVVKGEDTLIDAVTELPNLRGLTKWYDGYVTNPDKARKVIALSIYELPKYRYIYENYGIQAIEAAVCFVAEALRIANPNDSYIAHISDEDFVVINTFHTEDEIDGRINNATSVFFGIMDRFNQTNGKEYYVEVNAGCISAMNSEEKKLENLIQLATNEMYNNRVVYGEGDAQKGGNVTSKEKYDLFNLLVSKNMFDYYFQPIVRADNGEIYAYEALMRTNTKIGFSPLDVLAIAKEYKRLYDIERATIFNVMERYVNNKDTFRGRKVFINCIPGYCLDEEDRQKVSQKYSEDIHNFVFEITEQNTVTDVELGIIRSIGNAEGNNPIAIDDFGTGHSNIVNLIKYAPDIVKLDRFLMTDIHTDASKQMLVKSTIEFAKMRNIKVLAEGIETEEELRKVIELGVDYIQGYYTGRPANEPIAEIDEDIKEKICGS